MIASIMGDQSKVVELWLPLFTALTVVGISDRNARLKHAFVKKFFISFYICSLTRKRIYPLISNCKYKKNFPKYFPF